MLGSRFIPVTGGHDTITAIRSDSLGESWVQLVTDISWPGWSHQEWKAVSTHKKAPVSALTKTNGKLCLGTRAA